MKRYLLNLFNSNFVKNVFIVASGTVLAQIISLLLIPFVTRIYGPEAYGLLGTFLAIIGLLTPIAALTIPLGIVLPKENSEATSIIKLSLIIIGTVSLTTTIILYFFFQEIITLLQAQNIENYFYLIPIVLILSGLLDIMSQWLIRTNQYKIIAKATVYQPIIAYGGMILFGIFYPSATILIIFSVFKFGLTAFHLFYLMKKKKENPKIEFKKNKLSSFNTLKKYKDFPIYRAPEAFISGITLNLPVILLASLISPAAAGFYSIGRTALALPTQLIGKAVGNVFYPRIANASNNKESLISLIQKSTMALLLIGIIPYSIVVVFGPGIFSLAFGEEWIRAGEYAQWMSLMLLATFISRPSVQALPVINAQKFHLSYTIIMTLVRIVSLYYGLIVLKNDLIGVALYSVSSALLYILLIFIVIYKSKTYMKLNYN